MTRPLFHRSSARRAAAGTAAVALALTLVACADDGDDAAGTQTATTTDTGTGTTAATDVTPEEDADEDNAAEEDTVPGEAQSAQIQTSDGNTVLVDPAFGEQINRYAEDWGVPEQVQESDVGAVATFPDGNLLAQSEEGGVQPMVGMIAQTWVEDGALTNPLGMPVAPERENDGASGWGQEFTNGTITWARDDSGEFTATVS